MIRTLLILLIYFATCNLQSFSQQFPHYTQYYFNNFLINPAVAGSRESFDIKIGYRTQWVGFEAAPKTMFASVHAPVKPAKGKQKRFRAPNHDGVGGYIIKDQAGRIGGNYKPMG